MLIATKSVKEQDFFTRDATEVAKDLLGKYICYKRGNIIDKYLVVETEAYKSDEDCCYGHRKKPDQEKDGLSDKEYSEKKNLVCLPLFSTPGTWCIYGGQLLLSVHDDKKSDNVLIKLIKDGNDCLGPHKMACCLKLYKKYKQDRCDCYNKLSLFEESSLYIIDGEIITADINKPKKRKGLKGKEEEINREYRFGITIKKT